MCGHQLHISLWGPPPLQFRQGRDRHAISVKGLDLLEEILAVAGVTVQAAPELQQLTVTIFVKENGFLVAGFWRFHDVS